MVESSDALDQIWRGEHYRENTAHHRRHDPPFLSPLNVSPGQRVLDIGCGDGSLTARLQSESPGVDFVGIDSAPDMVATARRHAGPHLRFELGRAQEISYEGVFDVVISIAALHWVPRRDHPDVVARVLRALRAGGRFLADFGGEGNVASTIDAIRTVARREPFSPYVGGMPSPWFFPSAEWYRDLVLGAGFTEADAVLAEQPRSFAAAEFEGWLVSQTLHPWTVRLPEELRNEFVKQAVEACSAAAAAGDEFRANFIRVRLTAQADQPY